MVINTAFGGIRWPGKRTMTSSVSRTVLGRVLFEKNWGDQSVAGQTLYSPYGSATMALSGNRLALNGGSTDAHVRFASMPSLADVDVSFNVWNVGAESSLIYRTTSWVAVNDTYAYGVAFNGTNVILVRGSNAATGAYTWLGQAAHGVASGADAIVRVWHVGNSYKIWVNGVLKLSGTDSTFPGAGEVGVRSYGGTAYINSFQVREPEYTGQLIVVDAVFTRTPSVPTIVQPGLSPIPYGVMKTSLPIKARSDWLTGVLGQGIGRVSGTVKIKGTPNAPTHRKVRLYRDRDGLLMREAWSDPVTGAYSFDYVDELQTYTVMAIDYQHNFRAVVADNLTPDLIT
jgi:hypothetical protein